MIKTIDFHIKQLENMKTYPLELFYLGNSTLLSQAMISIVGTRRPSSYTKKFTHELAQKLANQNIVIVSGAAMGVDSLAHNGAGVSNTIAVVANGLDIRYPAVNRNLISQIENKGLILSQFPQNEKARSYTFVQRNEIVVALGDMLIVTQADRNSGSLRSVEFALAMGKKIYTLPHRMGESLGTQDLLKRGLAEVIYDIDSFIENLGYKSEEQSEDDLLEFCKSYPTYDEAVSKFGEKVFEYELLGKIKIGNGVISL
ncbi:MAG: DNA-protecting protein DprA [Campylobacteraceae bacterium]|nr:DNA-protecting protein DprA [Campylobacteraceae bacterium]